MTKPKASAAARGYGAEHQRTRKQLLPSAYGQLCTRCHKPLLEGQKLDLDHNDDRTGYLGFAHQRCNRAAGARKTNAIRRAKSAARVPKDSRW